MWIRSPREHRYGSYDGKLYGICSKRSQSDVSFIVRISHNHAFSIGNCSHTEGKIYDSTDPDVVRAQIASFIETYSIDLSELAQPDLLAYTVFHYASAAIYSSITEIIPF